MRRGRTTYAMAMQNLYMFCTNKLVPCPKQEHNTGFAFASYNPTQREESKSKAFNATQYALITGKYDKEAQYINTKQSLNNDTTT